MLLPSLVTMLLNHREAEKSTADFIDFRKDQNRLGLFCKEYSVLASYLKQSILLCALQLARRVENVKQSEQEFDDLQHAQ